METSLQIFIENKFLEKLNLCMILKLKKTYYLVYLALVSYLTNIHPLHLFGIRTQKLCPSENLLCKLGKPVRVSSYLVGHTQNPIHSFSCF